MELIIGAVIGIAAASIFFFLKYRKFGCLKIDESDPARTIYRIELSDLASAGKHSYVILKIKKADLSQE